MSNVLLGSVLAALGGSYFESKYASGYLEGKYTSKILDHGRYASSAVLTPTGVGSISPYHYEALTCVLYGVTPFILLGTGFWALVHGMQVGAARTKYIAQAKKDGEVDVDERYALPNLYAQGTSKNARAFNAVQRSHQHILETYPSVMLSSLVGAFSFPITTAVSTLAYAVGRIILSKNYAESEGEVAERYKNPLARLTWYGILSNFTLGFLSCVNIMSARKVVWN